METESHERLLERITSQQARFLRFLRRRVEDPATAEDILQSAYVRIMESGAEIRNDESVVAWFYRVLRNAVIDHYRRRDAQNRAREALAVEAAVSHQPQLEATACACIKDVVHELKDEYRAAIEQIDLGNTSVDDYAQSERISVNNAYVRLHRARKAVAKQLATVCGVCAQHRCLDCTCRRIQV